MNQVKIIAVFLMSIFLTGFIYGQQNDIEQANHAYQEGLKESLRLDRQKTLNEALRLYKNLEDSYKPTKSGLLYAAIGDLYYQLDNSALAIFYYYKALKIDPTNTTIKSHLYLAQNRLDLPIGFQQPFEEYAFSFGNYLDQWQRWEIFFILILLCLIVGLLNVYWPLKLWKIMTIVSSVLTGLVLLNLILTIYFIPLEGVLIEPSGLYHQPEKTQSQVTFNPVLKGTKVKIVGMNDEADWLKIEDLTGIVGYIPSSSIKII